MYSTYNEGKSVQVAERLIRTLKGKIYKKWQHAIDLDYLEKLVNENNNTYLCSVDKKPVHADYSALYEEIMNHEAPKLKVDDGVRISKHNFF